MTFVVTDNCIKCKFTDCVPVCPVDAFYEGENFLVIHPEVCIDCGLCVPECPAEAIYQDTQIPPEQHHYLQINADFAEVWPNITELKAAPDDANEWLGIENKLPMLQTDVEID